jgi:hypothetical protein
MAWAAELDQLGHVDLADPATAVPEELADPVPREVAEDAMAADPVGADPVGPDPVTPDPDHPAAPTPHNGFRQAIAMFSRSYNTAVRLREQILAGERRDHIPWTG